MLRIGGAAPTRSAAPKLPPTTPRQRPTPAAQPKERKHERLPPRSAGRTELTRRTARHPETRGKLNPPEVKPAHSPDQPLPPDAEPKVPPPASLPLNFFYLFHRLSFETNKKNAAGRPAAPRGWRDNEAPQPEGFVSHHISNAERSAGPGGRSSRPDRRATGPARWRICD